jgi:hypothetical protein
MGAQPLAMRLWLLYWRGSDDTKARLTHLPHPAEFRDVLSKGT